MDSLSPQLSAPGTRFGFLNLLNKLANADHRSTHTSPANFLHIIVCSHTQGVEAPVERFQYRLGPNVCANAARCPMLNVNGGSHRDLIALAIRLKRMKGRSLHQANHVRRGLNRGQLRMVRGERVLEFDGFLRFTTRADGDFFGHSLVPWENDLR
jgi:hypothetical protein